ncbi:cob(I)yrinic acid a,c-diamide adenosyltransferase [Umezakia ovalisporum]|jgi:cob(I)alamin adenosyltransferase|uniref:Cob(I)yrinic acid a,c-diamide adenosyltransferase n=2 Tax=Umezakia ovalisporum TaxID=75695 RepID=A0AA43H1Z2_9CYAN|nr:cob(I)yrinic acid a,c-diamide adenosyltransferase [Umezakia ovalisporum]MBI1240575.1 cob(I)yrinic acid a,c-diamide adenosyltransferase [Nostoc sp. RI_552]MDH6055530.1 cob(I)yrinic acid a,c-diamide adenosyltransferase [Umezakia ovalisporum FSS-43]MDH6065252.1 cob(I)yrinic acid a,c-diamide adenosyltransferase [Umezakia ovalisporum FSS-62]MDH6067101.1 cob(I)yrinic acid a,c-diamide adenosyltransferase [Umezakia ovalisporum APH033B]MDH6070046.1 cob(I)yrinic acid a,c-diamide adenosyltransferase [
MTRNGIGIRTAQVRPERLIGQIHVYDGVGKGKSQAALGVVLRSIGLGINTPGDSSRVLLLRFLKGPERDYDEDGAIAALQRGFPHLIDQVRTGRAEFFGPEEIITFDREEAARGWDVAKGAIASGLYSVVVLDEINPVLDLGLLPVDEVVRTLKSKPRELEIIATGRAAPQDLLDIADLHSEMKPQDHPTAKELFLQGIEIYTGAGKGKSTSALGKALKAIGRGINHPGSTRVLIMQWLKGGSGYTEDAAIAALQQSYPEVVDHQRCGRDAIVWRNSRQELDYVEAERGWEIAKTAIASGLYKTIILDELNPTVDLELLPVEPIVQALLRKPRDTEVIITGRCQQQPAYFDLASVHSEVYCHKHYANQGVELKRGVDF